MVPVHPLHPYEQVIQFPLTLSVLRGQVLTHNPLEPKPEAQVKQ